MKPNMGVMDRNVRLAVGAVLILLGLLHVVPGWVGIIGMVLAGTSYFAFCPAYLPLGINTGAKDPDAGKPAA